MEVSSWEKSSMGDLPLSCWVGNQTKMQCLVMAVFPVISSQSTWWVIPQGVPEKLIERNEHIRNQQSNIGLDKFSLGTSGFPLFFLLYTFPSTQFSVGLLLLVKVMVMPNMNTYIACVLHVLWICSSRRYEVTSTYHKYIYIYILYMYVYID